MVRGHQRVSSKRQISKLLLSVVTMELFMIMLVTLCIKIAVITADELFLKQNYEFH